MRYSYGTVDKRGDRQSVLAYRPQIFQRNDDLLIFPSKEFEKWQSEINELIDGIYQINSKTMEKGRDVDPSDLKLALGLLFNINEEMENLFDPDMKLDLSYYYLSTMDGKYKSRRSNWYGRYMHKIDRKVIEITPRMRYMHMMEIVDYAHRLWSLEESYEQKLKVKIKK